MKKYDPKIFCQRLKSLRKAKHFTQKYIADMLGIYLAAYQRYEYGTREPRLKQLCILASIFDVTTDYLLGMKETTK